MFENYKLRKKIEAFRKDSVKMFAYNKGRHTIILESGVRKVELAFKLTDFDGKRQLAFSGDIITSDGEALSRVMKTMWNHELPEEFSADEILRKQLFGDSVVTEVLEPEEQPVPETEPKAEVDTTAENGASDAEASSKPLSPIYFRDMAAYVTGQPNEVIVTVKASYRIDNR